MGLGSKQNSTGTLCLIAKKRKEEKRRQFHRHVNQKEESDTGC